MNIEELKQEINELSIEDLRDLEDACNGLATCLEEDQEENE